MPAQPRLLVIRLGAFGDFILMLGTMAEIRARHKTAHVTLLTTQPFADLGLKSGYFDRVWVIRRWKWNEVTQWLGFARDIRAGNFDAVYDLQMNDRTSIMRLLSPRKLQKSWPAPDLDPADIPKFPVPDMAWLDADISLFRLPQKFALLVPGCAPQHPQKRWPAIRYAALAQDMTRQGYTPVILGTKTEAEIAKQITAVAPEARDLCGKTSFMDIAALARKASAAVGNDTGPMHLIAAAGCPSVSLFSGFTDPAQSAPRGPSVTVLREDPIGNITVGAVTGAFLNIARKI